MSSDAPLPAPAEHKPDPIFSVPFSFRGRIGRAQYWIGFGIAFACLLFGLMLVAAVMNSTGGGAPVLGIPLLLLFIWIFAAVTVKRLRDAGFPTILALLWGIAPAIWIVGMLEWIEPMGGLIAIVLVLLFVTPGILPTKQPAPAEA